MLPFSRRTGVHKYHPAVPGRLAPPPIVSRRLGNRIESGLRQVGLTNGDGVERRLPIMCEFGSTS